MPKRVQRKREKGWRKPPGAVCVTRGTRWGNPHRVGTELERLLRERNPPPDDWGTIEELRAEAARVAVRKFEVDLRAGKLPVTVDDVRRELRGKDLLCWCPEGATCHGDVLLRIANEGKG